MLDARKHSNGKFNFTVLTFLRWNASINWCQKGCDISRGRMSDEIKRIEADNMCKMLAQSNYALREDEDLNNVEDMRIHATLYPTNALNIYKACAAGMRR